MKVHIEEVYKSSIKFLVPTGLDTTYRLVAQEAMRIVNGSAATIFMAEDNKLRRVYSTHPKLYEIEPRKKGYTYSVFRTGKTVILSTDKIAKVHPEITELNLKYDILIPLINKG